MKIRRLTFKRGMWFRTDYVVWSSRRTFLSLMKKGFFLEKETLEHTINSTVLSFQIERRYTSGIRLMVDLEFDISVLLPVIEVKSLKTLQC